MEIIDLDILRIKPKIVKLGGNEIDVSFVPCAITFDLDRIVRELSELKEDDIKNDNELAKKAFDLSIQLCAIFCEHKYPEMDSEWFYNNTSPAQIKGFSDSIKDALNAAYAGVDSNSKNLKAAKKKISH
jgi:hypothetical protein